MYFAAFKNHIGFYATPTGHEAFKEALKKYKQGKGSVQFPLNEPIPYKLVEDMIKCRVAENNTLSLVNKKMEDIVAYEADKTINT